jgi:hypothetical protein
VELHRPQLRFVRGLSDQGHRQTIDQPDLASAGRGLKDQVLYLLKAAQHAFPGFTGQKAAIGHDIVDAVGRHRLYGFNHGSVVKDGVFSFLVGVIGWRWAGTGVGPSL